jgi:hypothetical protein
MTFHTPIERPVRVDKKYFLKTKNSVKNNYRFKNRRFEIGDNIRF